MARCSSAIGTSTGTHQCRLDAGHEQQQPHEAREQSGKRGRPRCYRWRTTIDHLPRSAT